MKISSEGGDLFERVRMAETDIFSDLVKLARLNPKEDFRHARLDGVDLGGSDLSSFDLQYADLRRVKWGGILANPARFTYSLRGDGQSPVRGSDFEAIGATTLGAKTWGERFFSFKLLVDNWGENTTTFDLLVKIIERDKSTYMRNCAFTYFAAKYAGDEKMTSYCTQMARHGNTPTNMFRATKVKRAVDDYFQYYHSIEKPDRFPGDISPKRILKLRSNLSAVREDDRFL